MAFADELALLDATAQAELVRRGQVTAIELVEAAVARIERLNPALNAVVTPMYDEARRRARAEPTGVFAGVPYLLKDLLAACAGVPTTRGSALLRHVLPRDDSELVTRLRRAGLVVIGKTNTSELGILPTAEPRLFGPCRNPWNPACTPGGSSGGSAAAVAARLVPMAHGNDGGGSLRIPAACCGVFGLKPTRARNPLGPTVGDIMNGLVVEHAITRSVRDSAALLDATAGPATGDPYWAPPPPRPFAQEIGAACGRLRVAFTTVAPTGAPVHGDCVAAVHDAARLAVDLGHEVVEAAPALDVAAISEAFMAVWAAGIAWSLDAAASEAGRPPGPDDVEPFTATLAATGHAIDAARYLAAVAGLQTIARDVARFFETHDVWLTPVLAEPPLPLGSFAPTAEDPMLPLMRAALWVPFTPICNVTGQPAMAVPTYWTAEGLPVGTHWIGRFGDESTLFRLAAQLEAARPWSHRRAPVSA